MLEIAARMGRTITSASPGELKCCDEHTVQHIITGLRTHIAYVSVAQSRRLLISRSWLAFVLRDIQQVDFDTPDWIRQLGDCLRMIMKKSSEIFD